MLTDTKSFYVVGGTVPRGPPSYAVRSADAEILNALRAGEFCYVLTSRQMGKSSLVVRAVAALRQECVDCVVLDLTAIGQNVTQEQRYDGMLNLLGDQVDLRDELDTFWRDMSCLGSMQRFFQAIENVVFSFLGTAIADSYILVSVASLKRGVVRPVCYDSSPHRPGAARHRSASAVER